MVGFATRKSIMSVKKEVTEGSPVLPASATDFVKLQEGFEFSPEIESLENSELSGSIGGSKSILGLENPTASLSHYLRHSGVEAQGPDYEDMLEAAMGEKVAAPAEQLTAAGSTVSVINVAGGGGAQYERGKAVLVKDGTYKIRNTLSVSGDALTLGQNLPAGTEPAAGVALGRPILFKPKDEGQPTLTMVHYSSNGGGTEMVSGARVTEMSVDISAGQLINATYSMEGLEYYRNFIQITSSSKYIDFNDGAPKSASVAEGFYKHPSDLAAAIQDAMNAQTSDNITVVYNDVGANKGKFTLSSDGVTFELSFATGANTANTIAPKIGFAVADETGSASYNSDSVQVYSAPFTPVYDSSNPLAAKYHEVMVGDADDIFCFGAQSVALTLSNEVTDVLDICERTGRSGTNVTARSVTAEVVALMQQHDVDKFRRFINNEDTQFTYNAGQKTGGNWVAGTCVNLYMPTASITAFSETDGDGLRVINFTVTAYVKDALGEFYINLL